MFFFTDANHYVSIRFGLPFVSPLSEISQIDYALSERRQKKESYFRVIQAINRKSFLSME